MYYYALTVFQKTRLCFVLVRGAQHCHSPALICYGIMLCRAVIPLVINFKVFLFPSPPSVTPISCITAWQKKNKKTTLQEAKTFGENLKKSLSCMDPVFTYLIYSSVLPLLTVAHLRIWRPLCDGGWCKVKFELTKICHVLKFKKIGSLSLSGASSDPSDVIKWLIWHA